MTDRRPPRVLAVVPDLMDRSRITEAGSATVEFVASAAALRERLAGGDEPEIVVLDVARPATLDSVPSLRAATRARLIGFGAHVDRDVLARARQAGCDEVLARSAFFSRLPALLAHAQHPGMGP